MFMGRVTQGYTKHYHTINGQYVLLQKPILIMDVHVARVARAHVLKDFIAEHLLV